jgi:hypothetical protein
MQSRTCPTQDQELALLRLASRCHFGCRRRNTLLLAQRTRQKGSGVKDKRRHDQNGSTKGGFRHASYLDSLM